MSDEILRKSQIIFHYPSQKVGGCELLIIRLCKIASAENLDAKILCGLDEVYRQESFKDEVEFIENIKELKSNGLVFIVTPISEAARLLSVLDAENSESLRFIFAITHPQLLTRKIPFVSNVLKKFGLNINRTHKILLKFDFLAARKLLQLTNKDKSAFYVIPQFRAHYEDTYCTELKSWTYLPLPIQAEFSISTNKRCVMSQAIRLTYVGRIEDAQTEVVKYLLLEIKKLGENYRIILNIVGDGRDIDSVKRCADEILRLNTSIEFMGRLNPDELAEVIINQSDICFGTGTSALESASRGVPTCLLDGSFIPLKAYGFRWIFNPSPYPLGCLLEDYPDFKGGKLSLTQLLDEYINNQRSISSETKAWVYKNHSYENASRLLIELVKSGGTKYIDLLNTGLKSTYYKHVLWSRIKTFVKNSARQKYQK
jgi:glycosyltransferase involved in cell wall biosynthesis